VHCVRRRVQSSARLGINMYLAVYGSGCHTRALLRAGAVPATGLRRHLSLRGTPAAGLAERVVRLCHGSDELGPGGDVHAGGHGAREAAAGCAAPAAPARHAAAGERALDAYFCDTVNRDAGIVWSVHAAQSGQSRLTVTQGQRWSPRTSAVQQLPPTHRNTCPQAPLGPALSGHGSGSGGMAQTHSGSSGNSAGGGGGGGHAAASAAPMQETVHDSAAEKAARVKEKNRCLTCCAWTNSALWAVVSVSSICSLCVVVRMEQTWCVIHCAK